DGLFEFPRGGGATPQALGRFWVTLRTIRAKRFDCVLDLQGLARSGIMAWLANADTVIGLDNDREGRREGAQTFYDVLAPRSPAATHAVDRYLSVLSVLRVPVH